MMFSKTKSLYALAAAVLFGAGLATSQIMPSAEAQSSGKAPVILTVNQARLIATSKAGQSIGPQIETLTASAQAEYEAVVNQYMKDAEELNNKKASMEENAYLQAAREMAQRQQSLSVFSQIKKQEISLSEQKAINVIAEAMEPILQQIVDARGATVLLERQDILYAAQETDITQEALTKLDAKLSNVKVEKVSLTKRSDEGSAE